MRCYQHTQTAYCTNPDCANETGFEVPWAPDTGPTYASGGEQGYPLIEECPACGSAYSDEPINWEDPIEGLLDELLQAGAITYDNQTDRKALYKAVLAELKRQADDRIYETVPCRECSGDGQYQAPNSIWPVETLDLTCEACKGKGTVRRVRKELTRKAA